MKGRSETIQVNLQSFKRTKFKEKPHFLIDQKYTSKFRFSWSLPLYRHVNILILVEKGFLLIPKDSYKGKALTK